MCGLHLHLYLAPFRQCFVEAITAVVMAVSPSVLHRTKMSAHSALQNDIFSSSGYKCLGSSSCWKVNLLPSLKSFAASNRFSSWIDLHLTPIKSEQPSCPW
ncbi:hypothetical protein ATANTOWER_013759 [Ataeniobius toweri]|uniref:Secreted protein n=1 Tax=Ataeniobius toweri TaxID=208326 RepID=A0ABU7APL7_9TELE|nr:hypothetical protein [Ataeniobius toweri]